MAKTDLEIKLQIDENEKMSRALKPGQLRSPLFWHDDSSFLSIDLRLSEKEKAAFQSLSDKFQRPGHIWIASSGSTASSQQSAKLIALSKKAFLASARSVNQHLQVQVGEKWILALPLFHVGGLSIFARALLSNSEVYDGLDAQKKWDPFLFVGCIDATGAAYSSLVPSQVHDLVKMDLTSPSCLKAIVIGGAALDKNLYVKAKQLGWPLLPSFGMTEVCSQIATAELGSESFDLKVLSHLKIKTVAQKLYIRSESLMTGYAQTINGEEKWFEPFFEDQIDHKDWFETEDFVNVIEKKGAQYLESLGRGSDFVKILGEGVNLSQLRNILNEVIQAEVDKGSESATATDLTVIALPDDRKQNQIFLVSENKVSQDFQNLIHTRFNQRVRSIEKSESVLTVDQFPKSELGKIQFEKLKAALRP